MYICIATSVLAEGVAVCSVLRRYSQVLTHGQQLMACSMESDRKLGKALGTGSYYAAIV